MDQKIKELTEKIYREGVENGEHKAREIIAAAEGRAESIVSEAHAHAHKIIAGAEKKAAEIQRTMETDIRLSSTQAMAALKQQIIDAVFYHLIDKPVAASLADPATVKELLNVIVQNWNPGSSEPPALDVLLPEGRKEALLGALQAGLQETLCKGLDLRFTKNIKAGFQIRPRGSSFKISLTDEDFRLYFKEYLRPQTRIFLFGQ